MTARAKVHSVLVFLVFVNVAVFLAKRLLDGSIDPILKALGV